MPRSTASFVKTKSFPFMVYSARSVRALSTSVPCEKIFASAPPDSSAQTGNAAIAPISIAAQSNPASRFRIPDFMFFTAFPSFDVPLYAGGKKNRTEQAVLFDVGFSE